MERCRRDVGGRKREDERQGERGRGKEKGLRDRRIGRVRCADEWRAEKEKKNPIENGVDIAASAY